MKLGNEIRLSDLEDNKNDYHKSMDQVKTMAFDVGIPAPEHLITDGNIHRFQIGNKKQNKNGWYQLTESEYGITGAIGDHSRTFGGGENYISIKAYCRPLSPIEHLKVTEQIKKDSEKAQIEMEKKHERASKNCIFIWENAQHASIDHPYLQKKGLNSTHGAKISGDGRLILPAMDKSLEVKYLQYIDMDGEKRPQTGGTLKDVFWIIGDIKEKVFISEGFATGATVKEETGFPVVIAYNANNLPSTAKQIKELYPNTEIIIAADNDSDKEENRGKDVGEIHARKAVKETGCSYIMAPYPGDFNDYKANGGDVKEILCRPVEEDWLVSGDDLRNQPEPIKWLIKGWMQQHSMMMLHGPSGCGKTFVVLDMILHIALGQKEWNGKKIHNGPVVYLAGEGYRGIRARYNGWLQEKELTQDFGNQFSVSKSGTELDRPHGLQKVIDSISKMDVTPSLIVVDTLHRFLQEDEDKDMSVKGMDKNCSILKQKYGCSILLVHHTGHSLSTQNRGKGSAAWRGIMEVEFSLQPVGDLRDPEMVLKVAKIKDGEYPDDLYLKRKQITLKGWLDEDKEQVTTVVIEPLEETEQKKKNPKKENKDESKKNLFLETIARVWRDSGSEIERDRAYISRESLEKKLLSEGRKERTVQNDLNPSYEDKLIGFLIRKEQLSTYKKGWIVLDKVVSSSIILPETRKP